MPNRIIKESIRTSKKVNALSDFEFRIWAYLITYVDDFGRGSADPELLKGFVFPRRAGITDSQISNALNDLAKSGMITLYESDGELYFFFPNWDKHQQIRAKKSKFPEPESICNQMIADDSRCSRNPIQSNPNRESESESESNTRMSAFDAFWKAYPKKVGKQAALKAFQRVKVPLETLLTAIERQKCGSQWSKDNGQYIPNPATWLNQGRWEDEVYTATQEMKRYTTKGSFFDDE